MIIGLEIKFFSGLILTINPQSIGPTDQKINNNTNIINKI